MQLIEIDGAQCGRLEHFGEKVQSYTAKFPLVCNTCLWSLGWKIPWADQHTARELSHYRTSLQMKARFCVFFPHTEYSCLLYSIRLGDSELK